MSQRTLPLLFFNLGGEMLYILHQRLHAQKVLPAKASKVMQDMVKTMFSQQCVEELFQPQNLFSHAGLKVLFQKVAHSSIMRLNNVAMEKLYDLMSMAFKYQLLVLPRPEDVILITLNHLDTIKQFVADSELCQDMVRAACRRLNEHYSPLSKAEFMVLRATMLSLLQDSNKKISVLLRQNLQRPNGTFVIPVGGPIPIGVEIPGAIRYYSETGDVSSTEHFSPPHLYSAAEKQGSWEVTGDRVTKLGCNIYTLDASSLRSKRRTVSEAVVNRSRRGEESEVRVQNKLEEEEEPEEADENASDAPATVELKLLHKLLGTSRKEGGTTFKLNLFPELELDDDDGDPAAAEETDNSSKNKDGVLHLEPHQQGTDELNKIRDDFTITDVGTSGDDLLDLMDKAVA